MSRSTHAWDFCYWWEVMKKPNTHSLTIYIACIFTYTVTFSCVSFTRIILCLLAVGKVWECWVSMKLVYRFFSRFICVETRVYHDTSSNTFILFYIYPSIFFQYFFSKIEVINESLNILSEILYQIPSIMVLYLYPTTQLLCLSGLRK